jgi:hypothetical protein
MVITSTDLKECETLEEAFGLLWQVNKERMDLLLEDFEVTEASIDQFVAEMK